MESDIRDKIMMMFFLVLLVGTLNPVIESRCTKERMTYERTQGYKVPDHMLQGSDSFVVLKLTADDECYSLCTDNEECLAYLLDYQNKSCILTKAEHALIRKQLVPNYAWSYHRKLCIAELQCRRQWSFDRIPGAQLNGYGDKTIAAIGSEDRCLEACAMEKSFKCRSARYDHDTENCVLFKHDRRVAAETFKKSLRDVDYLENQCIQDPSQCHFHLQKNRVIVHSHIHVNRFATTKEECQKSCLQFGSFRCRSFLFDPAKSLCLLTPEDSYSLTEEAIQFTEESVEYYEIGSCIEVQMRCESTSMIVILKVATPFNGKVYSVDHSLECFAVTAADTGEISLTIPLHGKKCGTRNMGNGTFTNSVIVQHHPYILRSSDRRIEVACDYDEITTRVRGGKEITEEEFQSLTQVVTGLAPTPSVRLRVVNGSGSDIKGVDLGEPLYLKVEMLDESVFGIFGSGLVARSGDESDMILLIDDQGCPVEPEVFPALLPDPETKSLMTPFQAFKFASDSTVKFQLTVSFCLEACTPVECNNRTAQKVAQSYGRRRRSASQADLSIFNIQAGDVVSDVTMESTLFVVSNLNSSWKEEETEQVSETRKEKVSFWLSNRGLCIGGNVVMTSAAILGLIQIIFVGSCILLLCISRQRRICHNKPCHCSSRASISSKAKLFNCS
ncbi:uncharacterized protein LOC143244814 isoform X2 [Tachypleus tridentatus]|uniref:uncharacterized protein LOC143244814 isoform X2 n=1 Tax=Tachypleus tridentatus TaxID=6853 RepID=UPI003FD6AA14